MKSFTLSFWLLVARLAFRFKGASFHGFFTLIICLALGVFAIGSVGAVSSMLLSVLQTEGQNILGGDVALRVTHEKATTQELAFLQKRGTLSSVIQLRAMAGNPSNSNVDSILAEVKGVDDLYPLYGSLQLSVASAAREMFTPAKVPGCAIASELLQRLQLQLGDVMTLGDMKCRVLALVVKEPDLLSAGFGFGPRVLVSTTALQNSSLTQFGSHVHYGYRLRLPENQRADSDVVNMITTLQDKFSQAGWRVYSRSNSAPTVRRLIKQMTLFLTLASFVTLVVGGIGVGNASRHALEKRTRDIAVLKCLGAQKNLVLCVYFLQLFTVALFGVVLGAAVAGGVPFITQDILTNIFNLPIQAGFAFTPLILSMLYGLLIAVGFIVLPLTRVGRTSPSSLLRATEDLSNHGKFWAARFTMAVAFFAAAGVMLLLTNAPYIVVWALLIVGAAFIILRLAAMGIVALIRRYKNKANPLWRMVLINLSKPGLNVTVGVVLSLGMALTLLTALANVQGNMVEYLSQDIQDDTPAFFFLDIPKDRLEEFSAVARSVEGFKKMESAPMMRGHIVALNGVKVEDLNPPPDLAWTIRGDRGITYAAMPPSNVEITSGSWWNGDTGELYVSLDERIAEGFDLKLGDTLSFHVLGTTLVATIANTRKVNWTNVAINFFMIFSPTPLKEAPHNYLATVAIEAGAETELQKKVVAQFPNVATVRIREAFVTANTMLQQVVMVTNIVSALTLIVAIFVLIGVYTSNYRATLYESVMLKVLGARRGRIFFLYGVQYMILGSIAAIVALVLGGAISYPVTDILFSFSWRFMPLVSLQTIGIAVGLTTVLGAIGTLVALTRKAAPVLRQQ